MPKFAELEINLQGPREQTYAVGFRFLAVGDDAIDIANEVGEFRPPSLRAADVEVDPVAYGQALADALFTDPVKAKLKEYRQKAQGGDGLRTRLVLPEKLQSLRWEAILDPDPLRKGAPLFAGGAMLLSRYLGSSSRRPARSRPKAALTALVAIANPKGDFSPREDGAVQPRKLAPIDVDGELKRASDALQSAHVTPASLTTNVTATGLMAKLREGFDILYLVCHGAMLGGEPHLWLDPEDPSQPYLPLPASELVRQIGDLPQVPRLVVLASCQSAGSRKAEDGGVLAAFGPQLVAEAGVGAVIAMQGNVQMATVEILMPEFFRALFEDGQMDRAMTTARGIARDKGCPDYWMPALFTRLQNGAIWYEPGFAGDKGEPFNWDILCASVKDGKCIPIIGPDLADYVFGSTRQLAQELAENEGYPYAGPEAGDLAKVAQFLRTRNQEDATIKKVKDVLTRNFVKSAEKILPTGAPASAKAVAEQLAKTATDPLRITAAFEASVYVTASSDSMFEEVLRATGKTGVTPLVMKWRDERRLVNADRGKATYERTQTEQFTGDPSKDKPCLFYIFGNRAKGQEASWVLTEDDVFDYLMQTSKYDLVPQVVADALSSRSIFFLGFSLDDWKFRVLFRMILAIEGNNDLSKLTHVGVQIDPDQSTLADLEYAKRYLERYFAAPTTMRDKKPPNIRIYWGTAADFLRQLNEKLATYQPSLDV